MRLRFSLRTLFLLMTAVAGLCLWFILPSLTARRFLAAVANADFQSADAFFLNADDRCLANWSDKRWGFRSSVELQPLTFAQFWRNKREVLLEMSYFEFDQNFNVEMRVAVTPFGLTKPEISPARRLGFFYDDRAERALRAR